MPLLISYCNNLVRRLECSPQDLIILAAVILSLSGSASFSGWYGWFKFVNNARNYRLFASPAFADLNFVKPKVLAVDHLFDFLFGKEAFVDASECG